ncbi:Heterodisulfide reductase, subunit C [Methanocella conradii HZ254]|uniref:Heterodisulfide reductase, subunit C n=1 Tax=Methanocella conradii (strain DSM 24694 / JCM 17849 / CGMCC 1.5162 / HZ254) TaxID=1041930 RepID=H8I5Y7_METCZ|nr:4Fe-4S dicluster domain-containing protein [Methanocella conradii]AFD00221.1 Heterodisulfide reductase, subunit C [Methanocella conradii HZ254]
MSIVFFGSMRVALRNVAEPSGDFRLEETCGYEKCMQCGRCTASCPAAFIYEDYRPRDVMRMLQIGDREALMRVIWRCGQCYSCAARCPRNNSVGAGILALRESAMAAGLAPEGIMATAAMIRKNLYGHGETFLPATFDFLEEFGPKTTQRCRDNASRRVRLGFDRDDARARPIPANSMKEIRALIDMTWPGGEADA